MFLTRKSFWKILVLAICCFSFGCFSNILGVLFKCLGVGDNILFIVGAIQYFLCMFTVFWGRYAEGQGKWIRLGNELVCKELKPAEFIRQYVFLRNAPDLVVKKPGIDVLRLAAIAYDLLDDHERVLATVDEMIETVSDKKKNAAKLIKASYLFSYNRIEEAEAIFQDVQKQKLDVMSAGLIEGISKTDRAMAMGDYKTVECYDLNILNRSFPKLDNLTKLVLHYQLGEVYAKLQDKQNAIPHFQYCASFGGETGIRKSAEERLKLLNLDCD